MGGPFTLLVPVFVWASVLLAGVAMAVRPDRAVRSMVEQLEPARNVGGRGRMGVLASIGRTKPARRIEMGPTLLRRLELAGVGPSIDTIRGLKLVMASGPAVVFVVVGSFSPVALVSAAIAAAAGYRVPDLLLARKAGRRQQLIGSRVPDLVEVLLATTEAGLSPPLAFRRASELLTGPLGEELRSVIAHLDLGVPWQRALDELVEATEVPALRRLVTALTRSHRLGTPVRTALRGVADDLRSERRTRAEEMARRAPVKMLFPMVFLILPAFILLTVGPVLLATIRSLR